MLKIVEYYACKICNKYLIGVSMYKPYESH
jgi:hypothetical protein